MNNIAISIQQMLAQFDSYINKNFPVQEVSQFLKTHPLQQKVLEQYTFFNNSHYTRNLIHKCKDYELMAVCWKPGQIAPIHGHEGEKCWARVESGKLKICNYKLENSTTPLQIKKTSEIIGETGYLDGPADIHKVENPFDENAISLHLYTKPFNKCDIYNLDTGTKDRVALSYYSEFGAPCETT